MSAVEDTAAVSPQAVEDDVQAKANDADPDHIAYLEAAYPNNNGFEPIDFTNKTCCCCCCLGFVWQVVSISVMGSFLFGFNLSLLNTAIRSISVNYGWCDARPTTTGCTGSQNRTAFISTAVFIGAAVGSIFGGSLLKQGRRMMFLIADMVMMFGVVSSCVANSFPALLWARLVVGLAVGLVSVVTPTYIAEMTPPKERGKFGVMHQLLVTIGIFVAVLLGLPLKAPDGTMGWQQAMFDKIWWRVMLGLGMIPTIIMMYMYIKVYDFETAQYYYENRRYDDATNLLKLINGKDDVSSELQDMKNGLEETERAREASLTCCKALCRQQYSLVIMVGVLLSAFQQLSGINVFIAQSNALFEGAGFTGWAVTGFSVAITGINVIMTFPSLWLIEALGRRSLLLIGTMGQFVGVVPAAICYWIDDSATYTQWLAIAGSLVFICFFAVSYGPILWVFLFEIYPAEIRGGAAGAATAVNWIAGIVMVFVTNYLNNDVSFTLFAALSLVAFFIVLGMVRETKGRTLENSPYTSKKGPNMDPHPLDP